MINSEKFAHYDSWSDPLKNFHRKIGIRINVNFPELALNKFAWEIRRRKLIDLYLW